jgi:hypothetical protein
MLRTSLLHPPSNPDRSDLIGWLTVNRTPSPWLVFKRVSIEFHN